jgi:cysteine desulfurase
LPRHFLAGRTAADHWQSRHPAATGLHAALQSAVPDLALNGHSHDRLPNTLNVSFPGHDGERLLACTPWVAAATGAACHSGRTEASAVVTAMDSIAAALLVLSA